MAIRSDARLGGSIPQMNRSPEGRGIKPLFHSVRDIALILDKTVKPGYGVIRSGTVMSVCSVTGMLYPYPVADAGQNPTNAKAYLVQAPGSSAEILYTNIQDSYKFAVDDELIIDGGSAGNVEIQSMANTTPTAGDVYTLTYAGVTLTGTALEEGSLATADLVASLIAGTNYSIMPFTLSAGSSVVTITFKEVGNVDTVVAGKSIGSGTPAVSVSTPGLAADATTTTAENLGPIKSIDRTAVNGTQAAITTTTAVTTHANFTAALFGNVYVKSADEASTPFAKAKFIIDADVDSGEGEFAVGALTSVVISNAVLYTTSLIGCDAAAKTDMGTVDDGRFTILK